MTKLLDKAIEAARGLTPDEQDEISKMILAMAEGGDLDDDIEPEHLAAIDKGIAQADRREFATEEQIAAVFRHVRK
jgi:hypothetical protein